MTITTYSGLKAAVASWMVRSDLTTTIPDFVVLAEADIRIDLRCRAMETLTTGTLTGETLTHPTNYLEARRFVIGTDPWRYVSPDVYQQFSSAASHEAVFTSIGQSLYVLNGASGDAYSLLYWQAFTAFSADPDTNWLLTYHPEVYLYASLKHGALFMKNDGDLAKYQQLYQDAVGRLTAREKQSAASGSPLQMRSTSVE